MLSSNSYITKDDLQLLIFLPLPPYCYYSVLPHLAYAVLEMQPRASFKLGKSCYKQLHAQPSNPPALVS